VTNITYFQVPVKPLWLGDYCWGNRWRN